MKLKDMRYLAEVLGLEYEGKSRAELSDLLRPTLPDRVPESKNGYVITCAQNSSPVHDGFWNNLNAYCKAGGYELLVAPGRYQWKGYAMPDLNYDPEVVPHLIWANTDLDRYCRLLSGVKTVFTATYPLDGLEVLFEGKWGILPHPRVHSKSVPVSGDTPQFLTTTGACTVPLYNDSKAGAKGNFHFSLGFVVVDYTGQNWDMRQVTATDDGNFIDKGVKWENGKRKKSTPLGYILGDSHFENRNQKMIELGVQIARKLGCKTLVHHDLYDCAKASHHEVYNPLHRAAYSGETVADSINQLNAWFEVMFADFENIIVSSNHQDHLDRWLKETDWRQIQSREDMIFYLELASAQVAACHRRNGGYTKVPAFSLVFEPNCQWRFAEKGETIGGVDISTHGHSGPKGSRGNPKAYAKFGAKKVTGHTHSPGQQGGVTTVGMNCSKQMSYLTGDGDQMYTDGIIDEYGKRQLIHKDPIRLNWKA